MRYLIPLLIAAAMFACNADECELTLDQCTGGTLNLELCRCECPPPPECEEGFHWECVEDDPPPPTGPNPEDYLMLIRVGDCEDIHDWRTCPDPSIMRNLGRNLQSNANRGWRDPEYVAIHCSWALEGGSEPIFPMTQKEMFAFADYGQFLEWGSDKEPKQGDYFRHYLPKQNRRCDESDPELARFCGRSWVKAEVWEEYNNRLRDHLDEATWLRGLVEDDPACGDCPYDSIKGWCECRNGVR